MQRSLAKLKEEVSALGLLSTFEASIPVGKKVGKQDYVNILHDHFMPEEGLPYPERQDLMVCRKLDDFKEHEVAGIVKGTTHYISEKLNGVRARLIYVRGKGFFMTSRNVSVKTYRNEEYTSHLTFRDLELPVDIGIDNFEIDCEGMCYDIVDTRPYTSKGCETTTTLHSVASMFSLDRVSSLKLQEKHTVFFKTFDILSLNDADYVRLKTPLHQRLDVLQDLTRKLQLIIPQILYVEHEDATDQAWETLSTVGLPVPATGNPQVKPTIEGAIYKAKDSLYIATKSRTPAWIKRKKWTDDIDAFIFDYKPGKSTAGWSHLVGDLRMAVHLRQPDGTTKQHWIGSVSNITMENRIAMTQTGPDGEVQLRPEYYGKVIAISGQEISARAKRLVHPRIERWREGIDGKEAEACIIELDEQFTLDLIEEEANESIDLNSSLDYTPECEFVNVPESQPWVDNQPKIVPNKPEELPRTAISDILGL